MEYTTEQFYTEQYLGGKEPNVPSSDISFWIRRATSEIRYYTFNRIDEMDALPEDVQMCCCEVMEKLYKSNLAQDSSGRVLKQYSNDGDSGTYVSEDLSESAVKKSVRNIIRRWLAHTDLLYCGG